MTVIQWLTQNWRLVVGVVLLTITFAFGYNTGASSVQRAWDSEKSLLEQERKELAEKHRLKIQELEIQRDKDAQDITDYKRAHPSGGVHVPSRPCGRPASPVGGVQAPAAKEPLPADVARPDTASEPRVEQVDDTAIQKAFNTLDIAGQDISLEADLTVNDCRVMAEYLKSLSKEK